MGWFGSYQWIANRKNKCLARWCSWLIWQDWRNEQSTGYRSVANSFSDIRQLYRAHEVNWMFLHAVLIQIVNNARKWLNVIIICPFMTQQIHDTFELWHLLRLHMDSKSCCTAVWNLQMQVNGRCIIRALRDWCTGTIFKIW